MSSSWIEIARRLMDYLRAERWLVIGAAVTAASGTLAYLLIPLTGMVNMPTAGVALLWVTLSLVVIGCHTVLQTIDLARNGEARPLSILWSRLKTRQALIVMIGTLLMAENLLFFCIIKPQLGQLVNFSADPLLAD